MSVQNVPVWLSLVPPFFSVLLAGFVAFVAWQQWRTAHNKLAIDLFDRRHAAYKVLVKTMHKRFVECHNATTLLPRGPFAWSDFYNAFEDARFLFGPDVVEALDDIDDALADLGAHHDRHLNAGLPLASLIDNPDFKSANGRYISASQRLGDAIPAYLMLGHVAKNRPVNPRRRW